MAKLDRRDLSDEFLDALLETHKETHRISYKMTEAIVDEIRHLRREIKFAQIQSSLHGLLPEKKDNSQSTIFSLGNSAKRP